MAEEDEELDAAVVEYRRAHNELSEAFAETLLKQKTFQWILRALIQI